MAIGEELALWRQVCCARALPKESKVMEAALVGENGELGTPQSFIRAFKPLRSAVEKGCTCALK